MKKVLMIVFVSIAVLVLTGCSTIEQWTHPDQTKVAGIWVDNAEIAKFDIESPASIDARINGDTYCKKCKKVNPGSVRICQYCGQYID